MNSIKAWISSLFSSILNWIFPRSLSIIELEAMSPADFALTARRVFDELPVGIHSIFKYKDPLVRRALWEVKYSGNKKIATLFAHLLHDAMNETLADAALFEQFIDPIVVPLPLSRERLHERGWNQAEMIARELVKNYPGYVLRTDILKKIKHTLPQTHLHRDARLKNLSGCFAVTDEARNFLKGKNIILIDDVTTTGSTIIEARRTLLRADARAVVAFTVAH